MVLRTLHLCSGYGGFELGLKLAGVECRTVAHVEREAHAAAVLVARMEDKTLDRAPIWSDLESFDGEPWRGRVDLITAGFPCQPFSDAGLRAGTEDPRWLWPHIDRIIGEVVPSFVFLENVRGLVKRALPLVLSDLAGRGFDAEWGLLSASDVGAPHKRERVWILGHSRRAGRWQVPGGTPRHESEDGRWEDSTDVTLGSGEDVAYSEGEHEREPHNKGRSYAREWRARHYLGGGSGSVANTNGEGLEGTGPSTRGRAVLAGSAGSLADPEGEGLQGGYRGGPEAPTAPSPSDRAGLADPEGSGREGGCVPGGPFGEEMAEQYGTSFPPHPDDFAGWYDYIGAGGPEPGIRRSTDGRPPELVERLHLLGNGLVPQVAAHAFTQLLKRLES